jgi:hypothetical protein
MDRHDRARAALTAAAHAAGSIVSVSSSTSTITGVRAGSDAPPVPCTRR